MYLYIDFSLFRKCAGDWREETQCPYDVSKYQWVHHMKDRSDDPSHHERTPLPRSYISLPVSSEEGGVSRNIFVTDNI